MIYIIFYKKVSWIYKSKKENILFRGEKKLSFVDTLIVDKNLEI